MYSLDYPKTLMTGLFKFNSYIRYIFAIFAFFKSKERTFETKKKYFLLHFQSSLPSSDIQILIF